MACTDTSFASMFGAEILEGDKDHFIRDRNSIALTHDLAVRLFGASHALNKTLLMITDDSTVKHVTVSHVIEDFASTSHFQADALLPITEEFENTFIGKVGALFSDLLHPEADALNTCFKIRPAHLLPVCREDGFHVPAKCRPECLLLS
jgi:hypothetical protein